MTKGKIVFVAILFNMDDSAEIADAINGILREASQHPDESGIEDYAFNDGGNSPRIPESIPHTYRSKEYEEGDFLDAL